MLRPDNMQATADETRPNHAHATVVKHIVALQTRASALPSARMTKNLSSAVGLMPRYG